MRGAGTLDVSTNGGGRVGSGHDGTRRLTPRRSVPNGRAALGALLVAGATVVLFSIADSRGHPALERYVVARHPLAIGARIDAGDLAITPLHLPEGALRGRLFTRTQRLVGAVVVAPVGAGELVQASAVIAAGAQPELRQISVPIEAARALGERLQPGELVDVVATFGTGADAFTIAVVDGARVVARDGGTGPLGDRKAQVVILAVDSSQQAMAIAHAISAGQLSLVRVSGAAPAGGSPEPYRAPRPGPAR
ncbi:MAG: hypothetical protein H0W70_11345 [Actinobacteria bacterium]|nr:hypothetical protein [Actinomycetota bacterium]